MQRSRDAGDSSSGTTRIATRFSRGRVPGSARSGVRHGFEARRTAGPPCAQDAERHGRACRPARTAAARPRCGRRRALDEEHVGDVFLEIRPAAADDAEAAARWVDALAKMYAGWASRRGMGLERLDPAEHLYAVSGLGAATLLVRERAHVLEVPEGREDGRAERLHALVQVAASPPGPSDESEPRPSAGASSRLAAWRERRPPLPRADAARPRRGPGLPHRPVRPRAGRRLRPVLGR